MSKASRCGVSCAIAAATRNSANAAKRLQRMVTASWHWHSLGLASALADKVMLRKRFVIETVLDTLKSEMGLEHSRHRSVINAMVHVLSCLVAYAFRPGKPSISLT